MEEVINQICEKFGIVYDTAAVNIKMLIEKSAKCYIVSSIIDMIVGLILFIIVGISSYIIFKKINEAKTTRRDNILYENHWGLSTFGCILTGIIGIITIVAIVVFFSGVDQLVGWSIAPEVQFLKMLMKQAG